MTPEQKLIAWSAIPGVAVIVLFYFVMSTASEQERTDRKLAGAHKQYEKYYGSHPNGALATDLAADYEQILSIAQARRLEVENEYAPPLPNEYTVSTLTRASGVLQKRLVELRNQSERRSIKIPASLPFEQGFTPHPDAITLGLAQLYLYYQSMQQLFDTTNEIDMADLGAYWTDEEQRLAYFTCEFQVVARFTAISKLVERINNQLNGMSVRSIILDRDVDESSDAPINAQLVIMLTTIRNEMWSMPIRKRSGDVQAGHNMATDVVVPDIVENNEANKDPRPDERERPVRSSTEASDQSQGNESSVRRRR